MIDDGTAPLSLTLGLDIPLPPASDAMLAAMRSELLASLQSLHSMPDNTAVFVLGTNSTRP